MFLGMIPPVQGDKEGSHCVDGKSNSLSLGKKSACGSLTSFVPIGRHFRHAGVRCCCGAARGPKYCYKCRRFNERGERRSAISAMPATTSPAYPGSGATLVTDS